MEYRDYIHLWLDGLYDEIEFWKNYMEKRGDEFGKADYEKEVRANSKFQMEEDLPDDQSRLIKFIDVGSGPFSKCGRVTDKCMLEISCVDPLADVYEILKKENGINNGNRIRRGFVEMLDKQFETNTFDIVHMSNSLDHSFDPLYGILQMLNICKIGGKVILRHSENEACNENYEGLHQWNLSLHNNENSFVIWNKTERYDVCKSLSAYADIELHPDVMWQDGTWKHNKVVLTKKREIELPHRDYLYMLFSNMYEVYANTMWDLANAGIGNRISRHREELEKRIIKADASELLRKFSSYNVVIYGLGKVGKALVDKLYEVNMPVTVIDRKPISYKTVCSITMDEYDFKNNDLIIVTVGYDGNIIKKELVEHGVSDDHIIFASEVIEYEDWK
ncbi:MAG: hypothetical protein QM657_09830 [Lacrimispora sp.]